MFWSNLAVRVGERLLVWAWSHSIDSPLGPDWVRKTVRQELDAIPKSVRSIDNVYRTEVAVLEDRLTRRYDPSMALNEAMQQAIENKKAARGPVEAIQPLTDKQLAALDYQRNHLRGILRRS